MTISNKQVITGEVYNNFAETVYVSLKSETILSEELDVELELILFEKFKGKKVRIMIEEVLD